MRTKIAGNVFIIMALLSPVLAAAPVNAAGQEATTVPLAVSNVAASDIGFSGATISWQTNAAATSQVWYDTVFHTNAADYALSTAIEPSLVMTHSLSLTGLSPDTTYHYRVKSTLTSGGVTSTAVSDDYTFTTLSAGGGGGPVTTTPATPTPTSTTTPSPTPTATSTPPPATTSRAETPGVTDISGLVTEEGLFTGPVTAASEDTMASLLIPAGATGLTRERQPLTIITVQMMAEPPDTPIMTDIIGSVYELLPRGTTFDTLLTITLHYDDSLLDEGIIEEELFLAYHDETSGQWIELESVVDTQRRTVTARIQRFMPIAIMNLRESARAPSAAAFTITDLRVSPGQVLPGGRVLIIIVVSNTGNQAGTYTVDLEINGVPEKRQTITVDAGLSKEVNFSVTKDTPGVYTVSAAGLSGSFTVMAPSAPPGNPSGHWPLFTGLITAAVVILGGVTLFFLVRRRRKPAGG